MTEDFDLHGLDPLAPDNLDDEDAVLDYFEELSECFEISPEMADLDMDVDDARFWVGRLVVDGFQSAGVRIGQSDAQQFKTVLLELFPRIIPPTRSLRLDNAIPALDAFWRFLGRVFGHPHAEEILALLPSLEEELVARMALPRDTARLGPRPQELTDFYDLTVPVDLGAIARLDPRSEAGQTEIDQYCAAAVRRFLCEPEAAKARELGENIQVWIVRFLREGIFQGMAPSPAELSAEDAEEILLRVLPPLFGYQRGSDAGEVVGVLQDFWRYLGRVHKAPNAGLIVSTLGSLTDRFQEALAAAEKSADPLSDDSLLGMAEAAGLDVDDPAQRQAFLSQIREDVAGELGDIPMDDYPGAGGMSPPPGGDPNRKKKRKAAKAARKANKSKKKKKK